MSKTIKLEDKVYLALTVLMGPKETYSQVVERLLAIRLIAGGLSEALQGEIKVKNHQKEEFKRFSELKPPYWSTYDADSHIEKDSQTTAN